jgi:hypothetical protein
MKLEITSTDTVKNDARLWTGTTESGVAVDVWVRAVTVDAKAAEADGVDVDAEFASLQQIGSSNDRWPYRIRAQDANGSDVIDRMFGHVLSAESLANNVGGALTEVLMRLPSSAVAFELWYDSAIIAHGVVDRSPASEIAAASVTPAFVLDTLVERAKQRSRWSSEHDDHEHAPGDLAAAAVFMALGITLWNLRSAPAWVTRLLSRHQDRRDRLVIATALLLAEGERLDRAQVVSR